MSASAPHVRWRLEVPLEIEEAFDEWLQARGANATYRAVDPPGAFFAYFSPGTRPDPAGLSGFPGVVLVEVEGFDDEDWLEKSREGFGAFEVGERFFVRPCWDRTEAPEGRIPLVVNPGLAFGTGGHETTRLCISLLENLAATGPMDGPVLDVGAGTGILALAAHHLGFRDLLAFDLDPDCEPAMEELISMNAPWLSGRIPFVGFIGEVQDPRIQAQAPFQGILANILLETIAELLPDLRRLSKASGWLVASGLLAEREDEALLTLASGGFTPQRILREGAWIAVLCERTA